MAAEIVQENKQCSKCSEIRQLSDFGKNHTRRDGLNGICKFCARRRWRERHPLKPEQVATTLDGEIWRPVVGFEAEFSISNLGRVRRDKGIKRTFANRLLKPNLANIGYYTVALHGRTTCVHRLVAEAFLEPEKRHLTVNHKNGIRTDNRVENLELVTHAENMAHAAGTLKRCGTRRLSEEKVRDIRRRFAAGGVTRSDLAREYGVWVTTICKVVDRVWWKHVA